MTYYYYRFLYINILIFIYINIIYIDDIAPILPVHSDIVICHTHRQCVLYTVVVLKSPYCV